MDSPRWRVLLAEDTRVSAMVARLALEAQGCQVVVARDGARAIAALEDGAFDVVLLDLQMPEVDGFGVARWLRAREREGRPPTPVIAALSAAPLEEVRLQCREAGIGTILGKPLEEDDIRALLADLGTGPGVFTEVAETPEALALDEAALEARLKGRRAIRLALQVAFEEDTHALQEQLEAALRTLDYAAVARAGHRLKGAAANLCAPALQQLGRKLEAAARAGDEATCRRLAGRLDAERDRLRQALA